MIAAQTELQHSSVLQKDKIGNTLLAQKTGPHPTGKEDLAWFCSNSKILNSLSNEVHIP